jgi:hypothetical protein
MVEGVGFFAARDHVIICPGRLGVIDKSISRCLVLSVRWSRLFGQFSAIFKWRFCFSV